MKEYIEPGPELNSGSKIIQNVLPFIELKVENISITALIDTGAELSLIKEKIIDNNRQIFQDKIIKVNKIRLKNANGKKLADVNKIVNIGINLGEENISAEFVVMPSLQFDAIIGADMVRQLKAKIDFEENVLIVNNMKVSIVDLSGIKDSLALEAISEKLNMQVHRDKSQLENNYNKGYNLTNNLNCPLNYIKEVNRIIQKHKNLINFQPRIAEGYVHRLEVNEEIKTFRCKPYPVPFKFKEQVKREIENMLIDGIIERAKTSYINPLVIVKKKNNEIRLCLDARKLNEITIPQYDAPQTIDAMLSRLGQTTIFSKLDLKNSFWLIPLAPESQKYTGFSVEGNIYQFKVVPFGLQSASAALVRAMQSILNKYEGFCLHYVDDILIFSENAKEHSVHLKMIISALDEAGMKINIEKCQFFSSDVQYLGYKINTSGITVGKERLEEIRAYPRPSNLKTLRGFLGILNYYKKFISHLSEKEVPLIELLRKGEKWSWDQRREKAFNDLKQEFHANLLLHSPDFSIPFILRTDASKNSVAAELVQFQNGIEVPICFISRVLKSYETRYSSTELEMCAIVFGVTRLKYYLIANHFIIETDHAALTFLLNNRFANNRIYRWSLLIQEFSFSIRYRPGKENITADALTRKEQADMGKSSFMVALNLCSSTQVLYSETKIKESQEKLIKLKESLISKGKYRGLMIKDDFIIKMYNNNELYVIQQKLAEQIIKDLHTRFGHIGIRKSWMIFRENYYSKNDLQITKSVIKECHLCCVGKIKNRVNQNRVESIVVTERLELVALDYVSNLITSQNGFKNMLIVTDIFSKYTKIYKTKRCNTKTTIAIMKDFINGVGKPRKVLVDNATYFSNDRFKTFLNTIGIEVIFTSIRHPNANPAERYVQETIKFLRLAIERNHTEWCRQVLKIESYLNNVPNTITEISPIKIMFNQEPQRPWKKTDNIKYEIILDQVRKRLERNSIRYKKRANKNIKNPISYEIGDLVIIKSLRVSNKKYKICAKLKLPYEGPYKVLKRTSHSTYEIGDLNDNIRGKFHVEVIYPYTPTIMKLP